MSIDLPPPLWVPPKPAIIRISDEPRRNHLGMPITMGIAAAHGGSVAPNIASSSTYSTSANASSHAVPMPSGIVAGQLLFVAMASSSPTPGYGMPTGWTQLSSGSRGFLTFGRIATGTEGSSQTFTTSTSMGVVGICLRISNNRSSLTGLTDFDLTGAYIAANRSSVSPTAFSPAWGTATTNLWIASLSWFDATTLISSYPSGYTISNMRVATSGTSSPISLAIAAIQKNASTETTPAWTYNATVTSGQVWEVHAFRQI